MTKTWGNLQVRAHRCPLGDALISRFRYSKNGEIVAKNLISYFSIFFKILPALE
jgi:hypothetical protein